MTERICAIHKDSDGRYGAPKTHAQLLKEGVKVSMKLVQRLMEKTSIRSNITKKYRPTPTQKPIEERENILEQDFQTTTINEKWVADITYIHNPQWMVLLGVGS